MQNNIIKTKDKNSPILFLLILAIALRIYNINSPIIGIHSWRQSDTAAIARNFYENGFNLFYPQIDWGGNSPGYYETEFPIYSFIVALIYRVFGVAEFWGRFLSIICFLVALYFLYQFIIKISDKKIASWSCLFFVILPLNIYYSRTFQPESMLLMCSVIGIYYFTNWLDSEKWQDLILSGSFVALACLIKVLPIIYLGIPLFYLAWTKYGIRVFSQISLWIYSILILISDVSEEYILSKAKLGAKYLVGSFNFVESYNLFVDDSQKQKVQNFLDRYPNILKDGINFIAKLP